MSREYWIDVEDKIGHIWGMEIWVRVGIVFVGAFLFLLGTWKTFWEFWSWYVLSKLGEQPPLVGDNPRVYFRLFVLVAALGAAILIAGVLPW